MSQNEPLSAQTCTRCGAELPVRSDECPRCLLRLGISAQPGREAAEALDSAVESQAPRGGPPPTLEEVRATFSTLEVESLLGQGGMGAVFRARQPHLDRAVALKVLPRALGEDATFAERFQREARALAKLSHPGIVTVHDHGCTDGLHYLVMELVDGVNLRELLQRGPLAPKQALRIVSELCDALQYAHDEGVVHRDIKPENILVDARGRIKVADFGLAKLVGATPEPLLTRSDQVMGTPHYMAPEQMERPLEVDHRADLFALGVVLYEMLTGSLPRGKFEPPSQRVRVDVELDQIVLKALEREPTRRYQHALEIKTDVEHLPSEGGVRVATAFAPAGAPRRTAARAEARRGGGFFREAQGAEQGWRAALLFGLGWIVLGLSWNLGPFACGVGVALVVATIARVLLVRVRAEPNLSAALRALPAGERRARRAILLLGSFLCVFAITVGHVMHWERGTHTWQPNPREVNGYFEQWARDPWQLLRSVAPANRVHEFFPPGIEPRVAMESNQSSVELPSTGKSAWVLILGGFVLLAVVLALTVRVSSSRALSRRAWHLGAELSSWSLLALGVLWVGAPIASLRKHQVFQEVSGVSETTLSREDARERLRSAFEDQGLEVEIEQNFSVRERRDGRELARATILRASSRDPFERWSTSFSGAIRETPQIWATIAARADGGGSKVFLRAGLLDPRQPQHDRAHALLRGLEEALIP